MLANESDRQNQLSFSLNQMTRTMVAVVGRINRFKAMEPMIIIAALEMCLGCQQWSKNRVLIAIFIWIKGLLELFIIHRATKEPDSCAFNFVNSKPETRSTVLVCIGDSITHGRLSSDWVSAIQPALCRPLHVVNNGQNSITTYTTLQERVQWALACKPDYVVVMIGTNDAHVLENPILGQFLRLVWGLPDPITPTTIEANLQGILEKLLKDPKLQVAVCTIPPLGEDLASEWNQNAVATVNHIIRKVQAVSGSRVTLLDVNGALQSRIRQSNTSGSNIALMVVHVVWQCFARFVLQVSWNDMSRWIGNTILTDGIHLNDEGGAIVTNFVIDWLRQHEHK
jgi:lysophospholipase L1-like esterase